MLVHMIFVIFKNNIEVSFYRAKQLYASAVLGIVILSVLLSVCHTRAL